MYCQCSSAMTGVGVALSVMHSIHVPRGVTGRTKTQQLNHAGAPGGSQQLQDSRLALQFFPLRAPRREREFDVRTLPYSLSDTTAPLCVR